MWNFIKGLFKFVFGTIFTVSLIAGVGAVAFAYIFKKILKKSKVKLKKSFQISKQIINLLIEHVKCSIFYANLKIAKKGGNSSYLSS